MTKDPNQEAKALVRSMKSAARRELDIEVQPPDVFLLHQADLDVAASVQLLRGQADEKSRPPRTVEGVLDRLAVNAPIFSAVMPDPGRPAIASLTTASL